MKNEISEMICQFIREYEQKSGISTRWGEPLVRFADAKHPYILDLKKIVSPSHQLPSDVLPDASIVIAYFVPFTKGTAATNRSPDGIASPEWAQAYEETNAMFAKINAHVIKEIQSMGYQADVSPEASVFDRTALISNWSQRHFARAAGLGTFGINNMLITKKGGCGRYSTIVTNLDVPPDMPLEEEFCLYLRNGSCGACVKHCPSGALKPDGYDRKKCYEVCLQNAARYTEFGSSYTGEREEAESHIGSEVCGKCVANVPCSFFK